MGQYYSPHTYRLRKISRYEISNLGNYKKGFKKNKIMIFVFKLVSNFSLRDKNAMRRRWWKNTAGR
jgi:hypothetical protein